MKRAFLAAVAAAALMAGASTALTLLPVLTCCCRIAHSRAVRIITDAQPVEYHGVGIAGNRDGNRSA